ncbi:hypothetical protein B0T17DRAFT_545549 [Bombardia bombarda]|uniref:Uncharacterized protein n=1 Tax=Bombardia bombarda TaxID=252184 RepID=A0AA39WAC3_9PEZI|nr:hypothetical protein B0T17DRAFT_545549 [Bombardia bombarda]
MASASLYAWHPPSICLNMVCFSFLFPFFLRPLALVPWILLGYFHHYYLLILLGFFFHVGYCIDTGYIYTFLGGVCLFCSFSFRMWRGLRSGRWRHFSTLVWLVVIMVFLSSQRDIS